MDVGADVQVVSVLGSWNMAACVMVVMGWRTEKKRSARSKWNGRMKAQMVYKVPAMRPCAGCEETPKERLLCRWIYDACGWIEVWVRAWMDEMGGSG
jgi:hypothetical protein